MPIIRLILLVYCSLVVCAVVIVPWSYERDGIRQSTGYAVFFSDAMYGKSIDYGRVALEIVALTGLAGIALLLQEHLKGLEKSVSNLRERIAISLSETKTCWNRYWDEELRVFRWRLSRSAIFWRIGVIIALGNILADLLGVDGIHRGWWSLGALIAMILLFYL